MQSSWVSYDLRAGDGCSQAALRPDYSILERQVSKHHFKLRGDREMTFLSNALHLSATEALDTALPRDAAATHARLDALARVMDSAVRVPGTNVTLGLDALLGLVPIAGNIATTLISSYLILEARRLGVSKFTLMRMMGNVGVDSIISAIPLAGNIGDVFFKANRRNLALLQKSLQAQQRISTTGRER
ncbi:MAG: DUF4112 domain-containing protein [Beijerinckiaceae bacterium]|nr:DUF4112 domain-containing protein [Beijerinckiaceae bacterium]